MTKRPFLPRRDALQAFGRYSHMGFLFGALTIGGFFLGRWIDNKIWSYPVFSILLFLLGFLLGMYKFILMISPKTQEKEKKEMDR